MVTQQIWWGEFNILTEQRNFQHIDKRINRWREKSFEQTWLVLKWSRSIPDRLFDTRINMSRDLYRYIETGWKQFKINKSIYKYGLDRDLDKNGNISRFSIRKHFTIHWQRSQYYLRLKFLKHFASNNITGKNVSQDQWLLPLFPAWMCFFFLAFACRKIFSLFSLAVISSACGSPQVM